MSQEKREAIKQKLTTVRDETVRVLNGLTEEQWNTPVYSDEGAEWRVIDVVRHMADSERGMTALMAQVQAGGEGVSPDFDLTRWNRRVVAKLQDKGPADLLAGMAANREALFTFIDTLADDDWAKQGRHASQRILSIEQVCHLIADHEQAHIAEIAA
ncbi:MAG: DinB family protein [Candidatus Promineofilum sp.]|nr:DinB family protein [Promineifilum sp.]